MAFWDEITLATQEAEGTKVNENHLIGKWRVIVVRDLPFRDQRLNGKIPKVLNSQISLVHFPCKLFWNKNNSRSCCIVQSRMQMQVLLSLINMLISSFEFLI